MTSRVIVGRGRLRQAAGVTTSPGRDRPAPLPNGAELRLGTVLPTREMTILDEHDPTPLLGLAQGLDADGVDSLWVGESVIARPRIDTVAILSAVAAVTRRATLGTAVLLPALRNRVGVAHQVASLDRISGGRLVLGVGAGFPGPDTRAEVDALGGDYLRRVPVLDETVAAMRDEWCAASDPGGAANAPARRRLSPPPTSPSGPPVWLAAGTPSGLARCGRLYDGWLPYPVTPEEYAAGLAEVRRAAIEAGRPATAVAPGLYVTVAIGVGDEPHVRLDEYCEAYYGAPRELVGLVQAMVSGPLDHIADRLWEYVEAGARHLVIRHGSLDREVVRPEAAALHERLRARVATIG